MKMLSFRVSDADAASVEHWARLLDIDRSQLLRQALRGYLSNLTAEAELLRCTQQPITEDEKSLSVVAEWGPAEDWADWADAKG